MSTYLIDFENVKSGGLTGIDSIRKEDSVHLFWSTRENKISIEMMELIRSSESEIVMHKAITGERDALDHQLCSYLGFLAGAQGETDFVIVSNDKAYDHLIEFWKKMNDTIKISRVSDIGKAVEILRRQEAAREAARRAVEKAVEKAAEKAAEKAVVEELTENSVEETAPVLNTEAEKAEKPEQTVKEAAEEVRHGRNARRRERGGRYLKNGRQGREGRRNTYMEEAALAQVRERSDYEVEEKPQQPVEEKSVISPAAYVVSGITSGILVESGFTADGILDKKEEKKPEPVREEAPAKEEISVNLELAEETETPAKAQEEPVEVQEELLEVQEETSVVREESAKVQEAPVEVQEAPVEVQEESAKAEEVSFTEQKESAAGEELPVSEQEVSSEEKPDNTEKKLRSRSSKTTGRTKKSRTAKTKEHTPKAPATAADVEAKYEEAAHAEWTADVVRLINESKDLKELYASIVKLLGQENGRKVYRAIKVLK